LFYIFFAFKARQHDLAAAFLAPDAKVHAGAQHEKLIFPAGVGFFHDKRVADSNIHKGYYIILALV
jgi:hypothetical protein